MFPTPGRQTAGMSAPGLPLCVASPKSPYFMVVESDKGFKLRRLLIDSLITVVCSLPIFSSPFLFLLAFAGRRPSSHFSGAPFLPRRAVTLGAWAVLSFTLSLFLCSFPHDSLSLNRSGAGLSGPAGHHHGAGRTGLEDISCQRGEL